MKKIFYGWWIVFASTILSFYISGIVFASFTAYFEPLINEFGWSYTQVSFAFSLRGFEMSIFAPILGFLISRFGTRNLVFSGVLIVAGGLFLFSQSNSLLMFYISFLLLALGAGSCGGIVVMTAVTNWFKKNIGKAMGILSSGYGASGVMVPVVVWLIDSCEWRMTLIILGATMMVICIPLSFVFRERPEDYGLLPDGLPVSNQETVAGNPVKVKIGLTKALRHKSFMSLVAIEVMRQMAVSTIAVHVIPYLSSVGISRLTAGIIAAGFPFISITGRLLFGWLGDIYDKRSILALVYLLMGLGFFSFCYVSHFWAMIAFLLFFSVGLGGTMVIGRTILSEYFGREYFGRLLGISIGFASIGGIIGPTFAGWIFDTLRSYLLVWLIFCAFSLVSIGLALRIRPVTENEWE
ncbi:MAG: MFS transporter [Deltaproteobacteria bacterium]|nr:MFS transporter [Deltaproteobacteria bacterium]